MAGAFSCLCVTQPVYTLLVLPAAYDVDERVHSEGCCSCEVRRRCSTAGGVNDVRYGVLVRTVRAHADLPPIGVSFGIQRPSCSDAAGGVRTGELSRGDAPSSDRGKEDPTTVLAPAHPSPNGEDASAFWRKGLVCTVGADKRPGKGQATRGAIQSRHLQRGHGCQWGAEHGVHRLVEGAELGS